MIFSEKEGGIQGSGTQSIGGKEGKETNGPSTSTPLFDRIRIGGPAAMDAVVDLFYQKVIFDTRIAHFFQGVNMERLRSMQKAFLTMALGGPSKYNGRNLAEAHAPLVAKGLNDRHFDAVMDNLGKTLTELKVSPEVIAEAAKIAESTREAILGRDKGNAGKKAQTTTPNAKEIPQEASLFERLGGQEAVDAAVDVFYKKVLNDHRISHFFRGVDMNRQRSMQEAFLTMAFGGPSKYEGRDLGEAHAALVAKGLNDGHFDAVMENLGQTLAELEVPTGLIQEAAKIAESTRDTVLGRDKPESAKESQAALPKDGPLFDRIGGNAAVEAAVDLFYQKVTNDPRIRHFFHGIDMERLRSKQKAFLTMAFGGPSKYDGRSLDAAHAALRAKGLEDRHFDAVMDNLGKTLTELQVPAELIAEAAQIAESTREAVMGRDKQKPEKESQNPLPKSAPLFDRIGGPAAVEAAVDLFYQKVQNNTCIRHFFRDVDMVRLRAKQKAFLTMAFGGPSKYDGRSLDAAHAALREKGLEDRHFDAVINDLGKTLLELKVPQELIAEAAKIAESTRDAVLGREKK